MTTSSTRRRWGMLVIGVVLLTAIAIPNLRPRTIPGLGQIAPVPGPPRLGDCVTDPIDPSWAQPTQVHSASGAITADYAYPQLAMGPCQGSRYGEVTALISKPTTPVVSRGTDEPTVTDANVALCRSAANRYVGITPNGAQPTQPIGAWRPSQTVTTAVSTPSVRQHAAGQHWLACLVYLGASAGEPASLADQERYDRALRNAVSTGAESNRIGTCVAAADLGDNIVACATAHRGEVLALGNTKTRSRSRVDLQRSCSQVVQQSTDISDITAAGLSVKVVAVDNKDTPIQTATIPAGSYLACGVTTENNRTLDGSLLALGAKPIPWA